MEINENEIEENKDEESDKNSILSNNTDKNEDD